MSAGQGIEPSKLVPPPSCKICREYLLPEESGYCRNCQPATPRIVPGQRVRHEGGDIVTVRCCDPRFAYVEFDDKTLELDTSYLLSKYKGT